MHPPALAIVGWSGSGKTTLLARLVPELRQRGLRVGVVKHSSHPHPLHPEGSDTECHAAAGATFVAFATPTGVQLTFPEPAESVLSLLARFADTVDLVLVEGWKQGPLLAAERQDVLAVVSDTPVPEGTKRFSPDAVQDIATFIQQCCSLPSPSGRGSG